MGCLVCHRGHQKSSTRPAVHQGPTWWRNTSCWSPSNLMITITCSPSEAPYSLWFLSNWSVPFAWLIWLLHFSLSPLLWLSWHYRCWVSLIMPVIGLEMLHASLFWGKVCGLLWAAKSHRAICVSLLLKINEPHLLADCGEDSRRIETQGRQVVGVARETVEKVHALISFPFTEG